MDDSSREGEIDIQSLLQVPGNCLKARSSSLADNKIAAGDLAAVKFSAALDESKKPAQSTFYVGGGGDLSTSQTTDKRKNLCSSSSIRAISLGMDDFSGVGAWGDNIMQSSARIRTGHSSTTSSDEEVDKVGEHYRKVVLGEELGKEGGNDGQAVGVRNPQRLGKLPNGLPNFEVVNILVIDDSKVQRRLAEHVLSGPLGCEVWNAKGFESGEHALRYITNLEKRPDVLMVDQNLHSAGGRLNGNELVSQVIGMEGWKDTVIIGITAEGQDARDAFVKAGCHIVWTKPMPEKYEIQAAIYGIQQNRQRVKKAALLAEGQAQGLARVQIPIANEDRDTAAAIIEMATALAAGLSTS